MLIAVVNAATTDPSAGELAVTALLGVLACSLGGLMLKFSLDAGFFRRTTDAWLNGPLRVMRRTEPRPHRGMAKAAKVFYLILGSAFLLAGSLLIIASLAMAVT